MKNAIARGERLRNLFLGVIVLGAIAFALLPRLGLEAAPLPRFDLVAEATPLPRPVVEPQIVLAGAPPLPASLQATLDVSAGLLDELGLGALVAWIDK